MYMSLDIIWKQTIACNPNEPEDVICRIPGRETSIENGDSNLTHYIPTVRPRTSQKRVKICD